MMVSLCVDPKVGYRGLSTPSWGSWWKFGVIGFYFSYITRHSSSVFPTALVCPDKWRNIRRPGGKDQRRHIRLDLLNILWSWHSSWWYKRLVCACVCVGGGGRGAYDDKKPGWKSGAASISSREVAWTCPTLSGYAREFPMVKLHPSTPEKTKKWRTGTCQWSQYIPLLL